MFVLPDRAYSAFIFDCDGTLADSMPIHYEAWLEALRLHGATFDFTWDLFVSRAGMSLERTVEELSLQFAIALDPSVVAAEQRRRYDALQPTVKPIADVLNFARKVALKHPVSVASGGDAPTVRRTLHAIGATELFPIVVTVEEVKHGKPAPDLFLLAAQRMQVDPRDCLVFEDSVYGIEAAERAGMGAVLVNSNAPRPRLTTLVEVSV
jgi:HAD superfamily hydrolase (TIGR01509 family)